MTQAANKERRERLISLLGRLPDLSRSVSVRTLKHERFAGAGFELETLILDLNGKELVPAYYVKPLRGDGPYPAILYNHAHGNEWLPGKLELLEGRRTLQRPAYAEELASMGIASLCIDQWNFGERRGRTESALFKELLWNGEVLWGLMVYDSLKAVDYLASRDDIDENRIGTLGLSLGSTMAWWVAALDERIKVCVDICCLTDYQSLIETNGLDGHGIYYYVPDLLTHFSAADINALIAPRAHLALAGNLDPLTPPMGLDIIDSHLQQAYQKENAADAWQLIRSQTGHFETAEFRIEIKDWLTRWL